MISMGSKEIVKTELLSKIKLFINLSTIVEEYKFLTKKNEALK